MHSDCQLYTGLRNTKGINESYLCMMASVSRERSLGGRSTLNVVAPFHGLRRRKPAVPDCLFSTSHSASWIESLLLPLDLGCQDRLYSSVSPQTLPPEAEFHQHSGRKSYKCSSGDPQKFHRLAKPSLLMCAIAPWMSFCVRHRAYWIPQSLFLLALLTHPHFSCH